MSNTAEYLYGPIHITAPTGTVYEERPALLRTDERLGAVGLLTKKALRDALLGDETSWMLGTMLRGLLAGSIPKENWPCEIEKVVVPAWAPAFLAALEIPTFWGKPIEARTDDQDIWEVRWVRVTQ